ncbi:MAG: hypothetical protein WBA97_20325 [Actinophytocola sp.]|uniref:hypothetical protein n=1 Tax=Actinophytocola sp. TaxID=1872138 RepID=UPI003C77A96F
MDLQTGDEREVDAIRLPRWGGSPRRPMSLCRSWCSTRPVEPIRRCLRNFVARGRRSGSVRSYSYALLRWWRWLIVIDVEWDRATSAEIREFVLWLQRTTKPRRLARTKSAATAGTVNPITRKPYLDDRYQPRTVRHSNAVLRAFYEFWIERGEGPLVNPVPQERKNGRRPNAHHNPLEPFRPQGKLRYNPQVPKRRPRVISDQRWNEHACIRCPMLRVSPAQRGRLVEIAHNLTDRIAEAHANGWLGEVQGLQVSLDAARKKTCIAAQIGT